jgi:hypothetical protein
MDEFRGIPHHAGDLEDYIASKENDRHARHVVLRIDTVERIRLRLAELSAIVTQNALTEDDLAAWSNAGFVTGQEDA